eukprot:TRINITY_DN8508_c0_g1_i7.p1 TRINITY_DN8508_c0_g1~~TRINITY_DN8508_c0_g1_i7.p1  ORF type:complete len:1004 (+),score=378.28 TRINITY_DN8508_c0_g1_i7:424-3012(+)
MAAGQAGEDADDSGLPTIPALLQGVVEELSEVRSRSGEKLDDLAAAPPASFALRALLHVLAGRHPPAGKDEQERSKDAPQPFDPPCGGEPLSQLAEAITKVIGSGAYLAEFCANPTVSGMLQVLLSTATTCDQLHERVADEDCFWGLLRTPTSSRVVEAALAVPAAHARLHDIFVSNWGRIAATRFGAHAVEHWLRHSPSESVLQVAIAAVRSNVPSIVAGGHWAVLLGAAGGAEKLEAQRRAAVQLATAVARAVDSETTPAMTLVNLPGSRAGPRLLALLFSFGPGDADDLFSNFSKLDAGELVKMAQQQWCSFAVESFLKHATDKQAARVRQTLSGHALQMASSGPAGCFVVERLFQRSRKEGRVEIATELAASRRELETTIHGRLLSVNLRLDQLEHRRDEWDEVERKSAQKEKMLKEIFSAGQKQKRPAAAAQKPAQQQRAAAPKSAPQPPAPAAVPVARSGAAEPAAAADKKAAQKQRKKASAEAALAEAAAERAAWAGGASSPKRAQAEAPAGSDAKQAASDKQGAKRARTEPAASAPEPKRARAEEEAAPEDSRAAKLRAKRARAEAAAAEAAAERAAWSAGTGPGSQAKPAATQPAAAQPAAAPPAAAQPATKPAEAAAPEDGRAAKLRAKRARAEAAMAEAAAERAAWTAGSAPGSQAKPAAADGEAPPTTSGGKEAVKRTLAGAAAPAPEPKRARAEEEAAPEDSRAAKLRAKRARAEAAMAEAAAERAAWTAGSAPGSQAKPAAADGEAPPTTSGGKEAVKRTLAGAAAPAPEPKRAHSRRHRRRRRGRQRRDRQRRDRPRSRRCSRLRRRRETSEPRSSERSGREPRPRRRRLPRSEPRGLRKADEGRGR